MSNYDDQQHGSDIGGDIAGQLGNQVGDAIKEKAEKVAKEVAKETGKQVKKAVGKAGKKVAKAVGKAVAKAVAKAGQAIGKALLALIKVAGPWILLILAVVLLLYGAYSIVFETRGTEQNYTIDPRAENADSNTGYLTDNDLSAQNRAYKNFYFYHGQKSYWQIVGNNNKKLEQTEGEDKVEDYYRREEQFYLNPNLLFSLDEFLFKGNLKYPEQFTKPLYYDSDTLTLNDLTDNEKMVTAQSSEYKEGYTTGNKVNGIWDYGLASIFKYQEDEVKIMVEGEYVKKDVWDDVQKKVVTQDMTPETFSEELEKKDIWLINKAITFVGEYEWDFEVSKQELRALRDGSTDDVKTDMVKIWYDKYDEYEEIDIWGWVEVDEDSSETGDSSMCPFPSPGSATASIESAEKLALNNQGFGGFATTMYSPYVQNITLLSAKPAPTPTPAPSPSPTPTPVPKKKWICQVVGTEERLVETHQLYKYRQGAVYEYAPHPTNEVFTDRGDRYYRDYVYNFKTYIPESVVNGFDFHDRVGTLLNTHFDVGKHANEKSDRYMRSMGYLDIAVKYGAEYGVDPYMIIAQMAHESEGKPDINNKGLMQIIAVDAERDIWDRTITAKKTDGTEETITITKEERKDPDKSIKFAVMYMAKLTQMMDGDILKAIQAYNIGEGTMFWIRDHYPNSWQTLDWMNYRKEASLAVLGEGKGDPIYIEHVLQYYKGDGGYADLEQHDEQTGWEKFWGWVFPEYEETEKCNEYYNPATVQEADYILRMSTVMEEQLSFSDINVDALMFWDEGFMTAFKSQNITYSDLTNMIPGLVSYQAPLNISLPVVTKPYGSSTNPNTGKIEFNAGIEVAVPEGTNLYSISSGVVEEAVGDKPGSDTKYGNYIKIKHSDGTVAIYGHLESISVKSGDPVTKGQLIGTTGSSGDSTGDNLYLEFLVNGGRVDPFYIVSRPDAFIKNSTSLIQYAYTLLGSPYIWGSEGPVDWDGDNETSIGYDCSGFVATVFYYSGRNIGRQTVKSYWNNNIGTKVSFSDIQPEDILFFNTVGPLTHMGIYIGNNQFIHASSGQNKVVVATINSYWQNKLHGVMRVR